MAEIGGIGDAAMTSGHEDSSNSLHGAVFSAKSFAGMDEIVPQTDFMSSGRSNPIQGLLATQMPVPESGNPGQGLPLLRGILRSERSCISDQGLLDYSDEVGLSLKTSSPGPERRGIPLVFGHKRKNGRPLQDPVSSVVSVGRNYMRHELSTNSDRSLGSWSIACGPERLQEQLLPVGYHPADEEYDADEEDVCDCQGKSKERHCPPRPTKSLFLCKPAELGLGQDESEGVVNVDPKETHNGKAGKS
ncbi:hypothetical protein CH63R_07661 [Colletotrichum higginsianum IMI 349063]|uniref:Uncharacterized protein n=1 Tax=Colletotrichum higginsianum (strain IMI 349063) TaxID=759273 RepID=A0A1B7YA13_COLHI|nr:hypothetical protein CH63R_07661 [Colletotrichum higginsianum IMI 349063]OBR08896.1 hypothetical protein CH63R_07661 [Colletotrichum higginsianum IMI 349063]